ncbi:hypothetical protein RYX36_016321, partial [Vicia faba]
MELIFNSTMARVPSSPIIKSDAHNRSLCSLSVMLHNKFVQISSSPTRFRINKNSLFKVVSIENNNVQVVEGSGVDEIYDALVNRIMYLPSVCLSPNYNTIAHEVARRINKLWPEKSSSFDSQVQPSEFTIVIPMDGFLLYWSELDAIK